MSISKRAEARGHIVLLLIAASFLSSWAAAACTKGAAGCAIRAGPACSTCKQGFYKSGTSCTKCAPESCRDCSTATSCSSCVDGYFKTLTSSCQVCSAGCRTCYAATDAGCTSCQDGYYFDSVEGCKSCPEGCRLCYSKIGFAGVSVYCSTCSEGSLLPDGSCPSR